MADRGDVNHGLWLTALVIMAPALLLLLVLLTFGQLDWRWAALGLVGAGLIAFGIARLFVRELGVMRAYLAGKTMESPEISGLDVAASLRSPQARSLAAAADDAFRVIAERGAKLARQSSTAELVLEGMPDGVLRIDRRHIILDANPAAQRLIGGAAPGQGLTGLLRDPDFTRAVELALDGAGVQEASFVLRGEPEHIIRATVKPLDGRGPGEAAALVVLHDDTARRRLDQMRADFVANVSHELKTPLASLIGFIETIRGPAANDAEARDRFLEIMQEQAARMRRLVDDIMSLSRIELMEHEPPSARVALLPLLQALMETLQVQALGRRVSFTLERKTEDADALDVIGDRDQLIQVFQNLIDNAVKYGREGSAVIIAVARAGPERLPRRDGAPPPSSAVEVAVIDQGEGIAPENIARLTERFYRVDRGRSRQLGGTGLGLAIVKHILNRHGGALLIESKLGRGSRFTVVIPAA
jgi:two-component system phosphate regulon sensor histidine kinase PhoR